MNSRFHWFSVWLWKLNKVSWTVTPSLPGRKYSGPWQVVEHEDRLDHDHRDHHRSQQGQAVAAPLASRQLADLGARVIKIERPGGGDFARRYDRTVHGHVQPFRLAEPVEGVGDPRPEGSRRSRRPARSWWAGPTSSSRTTRPARPNGWVSAPNSCGSRPPQLICCSISGYGTSGPLRDAKAYDLLVQAETGLVSITGSEDAPAKAGIPAADIAAGMYAFSAVLAALYRRATPARERRCT